jgi:hypothetical protein
MERVWFRPAGWVYRPVSWQGFAAVAVAVVFCVLAFLAVDRHSHSASDTLFGFFPYGVPAFLLLNWLASRTSAT